LFGGLMVARHFINNIPTDRPHSLPMTARPMATYSADSPLARNPKEEPGDYRPVLTEYLAAAEDAKVQERMDYRAIPDRLAKLEEQLQFIGDTGPAASPAHIQQMATIKRRIFAQDRRIAKLEERHERMVQNYEDLIATSKVREAAMEDRLAELAHRV